MTNAKIIVTGLLVLGAYLALGAWIGLSHP